MRGFNLTAARKKVLQVLKTSREVDAGMQAIVDYCARLYPDPKWDRLRRLDFEKDVASLRQWLKSVLTKNPPPAKINGFWFGLHNPVIRGQPTAGLYLTGSDRLGTYDGTNDWACVPVYIPKTGKASSKVLSDIYRIAYGKDDDEEGNIAEYTCGLAYAALAIRELCRTLPPPLLLGAAESRGVGVGFDDGDFVMLGTITAKGFGPFKKPAPPRASGFYFLQRVPPYLITVSEVWPAGSRGYRGTKSVMQRHRLPDYSFVTMGGCAVLRPRAAGLIAEIAGEHIRLSPCAIKSEPGKFQHLQLLVTVPKLPPREKPPAPIFYVEEPRYHVGPIVTGEVKSRFEAQKITGIAFKPLR